MITVSKEGTLPYTAQLTFSSKEHGADGPGYESSWWAEHPVVGALSCIQFARGFPLFLQPPGFLCVALTVLELTVDQADLELICAWD